MSAQPLPRLSLLLLARLSLASAASAPPPGAQHFEQHDVQGDAAALVELVRHGTGSFGGVSMTLAIDAFRGSQAAAVKQSDMGSSPQFGAGKEYKKSDAERLLKMLVRAQSANCTRQTHAQAPRAGGVIFRPPLLCPGSLKDLLSAAAAAGAF